MMRTQIVSVAIGLLVLLLFVVTSVFAKTYESEIQAFVLHDSVLSMLTYVGVTVVAVVIAPISTLPLIPLASHVWGWVLAGTLSVIGWTIGAQIAFALARVLGKSFVDKIMSLEKIRTIEKRIPERNLFWTVVLLRMSMPVDVLSYALGLFSHMKTAPYFWSTLIGVTPFAFVFAYLGELPVGMQTITLFEILALGFVAYGIRKYMHT